MLIQIIQNTPFWVFGLFAALVALGVSQMFTRKVSMARMALTSAGLVAFSLYGTISAFPKLPLVLLAWAGTAAIAFGWMYTRRLPEGTGYDNWQGKFTIPGSAFPLVLIMGIFATKYVVGVMLAMQPALASQYAFALTAASLFGVFSGVFAARSARLWRLALKGRFGSQMLSV